MNILLLLLLVVAIFALDVFLHFALQHIGFDASIDSGRIKRMVLWGFTVWALLGWRAEVVRFEAVLDALAESQGDLHVCVARIRPQLRDAERRAAALAEAYRRATGISFEARAR